MISNTSNDLRAIGRRAMLGGLTTASLVAATPACAATPEMADWLSFRSRFMQPDGRVIDTGNKGQSHSEGQGCALMFSQRCNDQLSFRKILQWTDRVLRRPNDSLYAWRCAPDSLQVSDMNNATDGDLLIAWALIEAGARWGDAGLTRKGALIAEDILRLLIRNVGSARLLLPGAIGFEHVNHVVINPSTYVFPAFPALAAAYPDPAWMEIAAHGVAFLRAARFGKWGLPADWVAVPRAGPLSACIPAPGWPSRFSWDAVRVPLYMIWAGLQSEPAVSAAAQLWASPESRPQPAWIDLKSGASSGLTAPTGMVAIAALTLSSTRRASSPLNLPSVSEANDYYSAVLTFKARLASQDCVVRAA